MFQATARRRHRAESKAVRSRARQQRSRASRLRLEALEPRNLLSGTWTALTNVAPGTLNTMNLLSNGTVIADKAVGPGSFVLTPNSTGSYVNGTWSLAPDVPVGSNGYANRMYFATNVLPDGRLFLLGGESNSGSYVWNNSGAIYNPVTNIWTSIANFPEATFGGPTMVLPNGTVLAGSINGPQTYIYDPATNTWSDGPSKLYNDSSLFENWTQLPGGNILSYDLNDDGSGGANAAQMLNVSTMTWVAAGNAPVALGSSGTTSGPAGFSIGPALLLANGDVFQVGGDSNTALYNPSTNTWSAGPVIPNGLGGNFAPGAELPDGNVLFEAGATPAVGGPTDFFEYNPAANSITTIAPPAGLASGLATWGPYETRMALLPTGQVLWSPESLTGTGQLYVYTETGSPPAGSQPTISSVVADGLGDGNYTLTGTQINGLSAGASFGSSAEMDSNYPLVELTNASGKVYFARTYDWSSTGVATGSTPETTEFALPAGMPSGNYNLTVVADGIASSAFPVSFMVPTADLAVTDAGPSSVLAGANATYTITLTNNGPSAATDALLTDLLPAGSTLVSFAQTSGSDSFTINQSATNVAAEANSSITASSSDTFTLVVSAPINFYNGEVFSNSAAVSTNAIDPASANNTAAVTGSIVNTNQSSAFVVTNSGPSTGTEAGQATYTLTVTNNGPTDAPNVILTDVFGAHALEVSTTQSQGPGYSLTIPNEVLFLFGTIPAGQTATATVTVELAGYGGLTNSASAYSSSDPNTTTNTAVVTTIVPEAPIVVSSPIKVTVTSKSLSVSKEVVATFTHASGVEPASNFVATINWGDNSTSTGTVTKSGTTYSVTGSHTYSKSGTYTVTTTVTDPGGDPPVGATQNAAAMVATGNATIPATSTSSSGVTSNGAIANSATSASTAVSGGTPSVSSLESSLVKAAGAGGQLVADLDILDAVLEFLDGSKSDAFQLE